MALLVTLAELKEYLGVAAMECRYDLPLRAIAERASAAVEDYVGEPVLRSQRDHLFRGEGCTTVLLPYRRVNAVVAARRVARLGVAEEILAPGSYLLVPTPAGAAIERATAWEPCEFYSITLDMGYDAVPAPVRESVLSLAAAIAAKSSIAGLGRSRAGVARQAESVRDAVPAADGTLPAGAVLPLPAAPALNRDQRALLAPYRTIMMPW
ncbi:MAG TPA: hypothetical protein VHI13_15190 [Candidatus Kapabacteria bacterium]|nr:hypothetical protein [Candidatus Kapabacteria bacterium]